MSFLVITKVSDSRENFGFVPPMGSNRKLFKARAYLNAGIGEPCAGQKRANLVLFFRLKGGASLL